MTERVGAERRSYRFDARDTSGIFLGLGAVQCVLLGVGLLLSSLALTARVAAPAAALPAAVAALASFVRRGDRALWQWLPVAFEWARLRKRGRRWAAPLPLHPVRSTTLVLPPFLDGVRVVEVATYAGDSIPAVVLDDRLHTVTAVIPVWGGEFVLAGAARQEELLDRWGEVIAGLGTERGSPCWLSWSDFTGRAVLDRQQASRGTRETSGEDGDATHSYEELIDEVNSVAVSHEVLVGITIPPAENLDLGRGKQVQMHAMSASAQSVDRALRAAGLDPGAPLGGEALRRTLIARLDPVAARERLLRARLAHARSAVLERGPVAAEAAYDFVRVDRSWHRSFHVEEWPKVAVPPAWLEPFLSGAAVTRSMTVFFAPVPIHASRKRIERDLVKLDSDAAAKEEKGRRVDARHRRATAAVLEREQEIVSGFPETGYMGLVTVSAPTREALDADCRLVDQLACQHGLTLRRLDNQHDLALAASLPFGLAPRELLRR